MVMAARKAVSVGREQPFVSYHFVSLWAGQCSADRLQWRGERIWKGLERELAAVCDSLGSGEKAIVVELLDLRRGHLAHFWMVRRTASGLGARDGTRLGSGEVGRFL